MVRNAPRRVYDNVRFGGWSKKKEKCPLKYRQVANNISRVQVAVLLLSRLVKKPSILWILK